MYCSQQHRNKVYSEMDDVGRYEAVQMITEERRQFHDPSPHEISLPLKFLYNLYGRGYDIMWIKYGEKDLFTVLAAQLNFVGVFMDGEQLKEEVIRYERKNIDTLISSPFSQGLFFQSLDERGRRESYVKRVDDLESNNRYLESIDVHCISNMFGVEIYVFSPDYSSPLMLSLSEYKCDKGSSTKQISIVVDNSKHPTRVYRTTVVPVNKISNNPYDEKKVIVGGKLQR